MSTITDMKVCEPNLTQDEVGQILAPYKPCEFYYVLARLALCCAFWRKAKVVEIVYTCASGAAHTYRYFHKQLNNNILTPGCSDCFGDRAQPPCLQFNLGFIGGTWGYIEHQKLIDRSKYSK